MNDQQSLQRICIASGLATDESLRIYQLERIHSDNSLSVINAILSEVMRLERTDIRLDAQTPHINLYDTELKTKDRKRIVPLPFRIEAALRNNGSRSSLSITNNDC